MYLSIEQLRITLKVLDREVHPFFGTSFLAFKQLELAIDEPRKIDIADQETAILESFYNPVPESDYYYIPLRKVGPTKRWVSKRKYPDSGLQKTRTTTYKEAFIHPNKYEWAWAPHYTSKLEVQLKGVRVPAFHLAVWLFRDRNWPEGTQPEDIINFFFSFFNISDNEREILFNTAVPVSLLSPLIFDKEPFTWKNLRQLIGSPPDEAPDEGGGLESLDLIGVGPAKRLEIEFAPRLNLITGDNGLGKTFLLECAWWALSGNWADPDQPAYPRSDSLRPTIRYQISGSPEKSKVIEFDRRGQQWPVPYGKRPILPGIVIYSRVDGSAMIWDPAKHYWAADSERERGEETSDAIRLTQDQIWDGSDKPSAYGRKVSVCNGLIYDWVIWQYRPTTTTFETFTSVLERLSPHPKEFTLVPSTPIKLPRDNRDIPRLKLPYDDVPIVLLSAGIKRILSLAYLLVWTWEAHKEASQNIGKPPQYKIVLLIDEMEAHLHPQWQRVIVPALLEVIKVLEKRLEIQLIIATHSPLIMASVEPIFDETTDSLFTLDLINSELEINEIPYVKHGSVNSWLTSEVFNLERPYSVEAELALTEAKNLQLSNHPDPEKVKLISEQLVEHLPSIDPFWPRWKYFAEKHGVDL